ncbi:unnamed protein product [Vicia faba]|uniref:Uncharacterized protein n=1 Tax=Vicia faba TaxID=3906 RepID=A0AAV1BA76_VICFA|nr:unnamed protein product [Vicia faba]
MGNAEAVWALGPFVEVIHEEHFFVCNISVKKASGLKEGAVWPNRPILLCFLNVPKKHNGLNMLQPSENLSDYYSITIYILLLLREINNKNKTKRCSFIAFVRVSDHWYFR